MNYELNLMGRNKLNPITALESELYYPHLTDEEGQTQVTHPSSQSY